MVGMCGATMSDDYTDYYAEKLEEGLEFQDLISAELFKRGIVVVGYSSRKYQIQHGENMLGAEIKRDGNFRTTGNLYIEVAEKSHPSKPNYTPSGIMRKDNSWLFVIGDERTAYIFPTVYLRKLAASKGWRTVQTDTSRGYLMPMEDAESYAIRKLEMRERDNGFN